MSDYSEHYQYVASDYKPISINLNHLQQNVLAPDSGISDVVTNSKVLPDWSKCGVSCVASLSLGLVHQVFCLMVVQTVKMF